MAERESKSILGMRDAIDKQMAALDDTHTLRLGRLEEDEAFFNDHFSLLNVHILFPTLAERRGAIPVLDQRPPRFRRAVMRRYKNFIRRFLYRVGPERTYLGKNVQSMGRMLSLSETFPDARFIHIVRDPLVQLPSALGLVRAVAKGAHGRVRPPEDPYWRMVADMLIEQHLYLLEWERKLGPQRWLTLRYDDLIADPAAALRAVYDHFQIPIPEELAPTIDGANERAGEFRKQRQYSLDDYGISADEVRERLAPVYQAYQLG
ncbi:MAG: sulfotransferase, partial [Myxococcales bacterium]|nr:sulfotransferase [Myxococcales bacterium]